MCVPGWPLLMPFRRPPPPGSLLGCLEPHPRGWMFGDLSPAQLQGRVFWGSSENRRFLTASRERGTQQAGTGMQVGWPPDLEERGQQGVCLASSAPRGPRGPGQEWRAPASAGLGSRPWRCVCASVVTRRRGQSRPPPGAGEDGVRNPEGPSLPRSLPVGDVWFRAWASPVT